MDIGNQLKKARQKKQVTLDEVYQQTRIHPNVLSALEEDRFDKVLNPAYMRSFLKEYALYLGLDAVKILAEYNELHGGKKAEAKEPPRKELSSAGKKSPISGIDPAKIIRLIITAAGSVLVVLILIFLMRGAVRAVSSILRNKTTPLRGMSLAKKPQPATAAVKETGIKEKIQKGPQEVVSKPVPRPPEKVSTPAGEKLRLTITATDDVWIQLKVDGRIIFQNVLKKGSSERWEAVNNFTIWTGRAQAMQLNLNGSNLGTPGRGVKKEIIITREGIKK